MMIKAFASYLSTASPRRSASPAETPSTVTDLVSINPRHPSEKTKAAPAQGQGAGNASNADAATASQCAPEVWKPIVRQLVYPVLFENVPVEGLPRVLDQVVNDPDNHISRKQYLSAVESALKSRESLSRVGDADHPEASIRQYLRALQERLSQ